MSGYFFCLNSQKTLIDMPVYRLLSVSQWITKRTGSQDKEHIERMKGFLQAAEFLNAFPMRNWRRDKKCWASEEIKVNHMRVIF